jgi:hypothetical protein
MQNLRGVVPSELLMTLPSDYDISSYMQIMPMQREVFTVGDFEILMRVTNGRVDGSFAARIVDEM